MYLCLSEENERLQVTFGFLEEVKQRFSSVYGDRAQRAVENAFKSDFGRILAELMVKWNDNPPDDKFTMVRNQIGDVKQQALIGIGESSFCVSIILIPLICFT